MTLKNQRKKKRRKKREEKPKKRESERRSKTDLEEKEIKQIEMRKKELQRQPETEREEKRIKWKELSLLDRRSSGTKKRGERMKQLLVRLENKWRSLVQPQVVLNQNQFQLSNPKK